ncbi:LacI family DNA-binding transcriptional regulator [Microbacterium marinilacus]|uniref:LacI family DNA-binding transcriptional regulator n=1 Tax=Microbacterium marinilacus TaxID=415209 RepID=A0ABP7BXW5_9MICO|nr:LacI family DNA-binding transcriptional regulator [Microbacterium marinilacus]MBY0688049.1 LacI family transcriptional regulator [Microbacterium marinilacus]
MRQPGRRVTIYDVAERAGVSISTVSLAVNSPHRVRESTRAQVLAAAGALGYRTEQAPPQRRAGTRIAVAAPFSSYPTYLRRLTGMLTRTRNTAIEIVAHDLESAARSVAPLLDALPARRGMDGLIVMGVPLSGAALRASRESRLPVVLIDVRGADRPSSAPSAVLVDDLAGGRAIGRHLCERGHRRAIFLHEPQMSGDYLSAAMVRVAGIQEFVDVVDTVCPPSAAPGDVASAALRAHPSATAVVAHHDGLAARVWQHFRASGRSREEGVALVGYDDGTVAETIGLTTVRQPFEESGAAALRLMIDEIAVGGGTPQTVTLEPELIIRAST